MESIAPLNPMIFEVILNLIASIDNLISVLNRFTGVPYINSLFS